MTAIIVDRITRVRGGGIGVAGVDYETQAHVRPVTREGPFLPGEALAANGGPFELGALVDLGETVPEPRPPQLENHRFDLAAAKRELQLDAEEFLELLEGLSCDGLGEAFGPELRKLEPTAAAPQGEGERSLACMRLPPRSRLRDEPEEGRERWHAPEPRERLRERLRLYLHDPELPCKPPVIDLRFYGPDHESLREEVFADVAARLEREVPAVAMVGLTHAFTPSHDFPRQHWLTVDGICLADRPLAREP